MWENITQVRALSTEAVGKFLNSKLSSGSDQDLQDALECALAYALVRGNMSHLDTLATSLKVPKGDIEKYQSAVSEILNKNTLQGAAFAAAGNHLDITLLLPKILADSSIGEVDAQDLKKLIETLNSDPSTVMTLIAVAGELEGRAPNLDNMRLKVALDHFEAQQKSAKEFAADVAAIKKGNLDPVKAAEIKEKVVMAAIIYGLTKGNSSPKSAASNLTSSGTLTNRYPDDPSVLQKPSRTLVQDSSGRYWLESKTGNRITPSGSYDFVTMPDGSIRVARPNTEQGYSTHLGLSGGAEVKYAGSIRFGNNAGPNRGTISSWNNNSGHYTPPAGLFSNAGLPQKLFVAPQ